MENLVDVYKGKKVFVTGHTGFKGSWLSLWLIMLGAEVYGYSLEPQTDPSLFKTLKLENRMTSIIGDVRDEENLNAKMTQCKPDMVFHLAAQPLVRESYKNPIITYSTNVMGTLNTLETARKCGTVSAFVNVTTDKCYDNIEKDYAYKETDRMGGYDMYSSSKACSEILSDSYRKSFLSAGYSLATARAGNVIGGGDWASERLIPDCIRSFEKSEPVILRNPKATRPWQFVLDALYGYLLLGSKLLTQKEGFDEAFNFGPDSAQSVETVVNQLCKHWDGSQIQYKEEDRLHEASLLMLDSSKARETLGWEPKYPLRKAVLETTVWYKGYYDGFDMSVASEMDIRSYMAGEG